jgi:hypothetical protein
MAFYFNIQSCSPLIYPFFWTTSLLRGRTACHLRLGVFAELKRAVRRGKACEIDTVRVLEDGVRVRRSKRSPLKKREMTLKRCGWVNADDPLLLEYYDREWSVPAHSDREHFEVLVLSGAQAEVQLNKGGQDDYPTVIVESNYRASGFGMRAHLRRLIGR